MPREKATWWVWKSIWEAALLGKVEKRTVCSLMSDEIGNTSGEVTWKGDHKDNLDPCNQEDEWHLAIVLDGNQWRHLQRKKITFSKHNHNQTNNEKKLTNQGKKANIYELNYRWRQHTKVTHTLKVTCWHITHRVYFTPFSYTMQFMLILELRQLAYYETNFRTQNLFLHTH